MTKKRARIRAARRVRAALKVSLPAAMAVVRFAERVWPYEAAIEDHPQGVSFPVQRGSRGTGRLMFPRMFSGEEVWVDIEFRPCCSDPDHGHNAHFCGFRIWDRFVPMHEMVVP